MRYDDNFDYKVTLTEVKQTSTRSEEDPQSNPVGSQIEKDVGDTETTTKTTSNAHSYLENYLRESARGLISIKNGRVVKTKKTDTYVSKKTMIITRF